MTIRPKAATATRTHTHQVADAVDAAVARSTRRSVTLPVVGEVPVPPPERLAYYTGIGVLAAIGLIEWPVAAVIGVGHVLADQHWSRTLSGVGTALEDA
jgi:hypothetical protein